MRSLMEKSLNLDYRISSYSFRGDYSFLNLEIQRSQYIRPKVRVHKSLGGNYSRVETSWGNTVTQIKVTWFGTYFKVRQSFRCLWLTCKSNFLLKFHLKTIALTDKTDPVQCTVVAFSTSTSPLIPSGPRDWFHMSI